MLERVLLAFAAILLVAPDWTATIIGLVIAVPIALRLHSVARKAPAVA